MNLPRSAWHYEIVVYASDNKIGLMQNYKVVVVYPAYSNEEYINRMGYEGEWTGWVKTATATKPAVYDLPLAAGITARNVIDSSSPAQNTYCKNQFGEVTVTASYCRSDTSDDIANGELVCTLPVGFRPAKPIEREATVVYRGDIHPAAGVMVNPNGQIRVNLQINVPYTRGKFQFTFPAA